MTKIDSRYEIRSTNPNLSIFYYFWKSTPLRFVTGPLSVVHCSFSFKLVQLKLNFLAEKVRVELAGRHAFRAGRSCDKKSASLRPVFLGIAGGGRRDVEVGIIRPPKSNRGRVRSHPLQWNGRHNLRGLRVNLDHLKIQDRPFEKSPDFGTHARVKGAFLSSRKFLFRPDVSTNNFKENKYIPGQGLLSYCFLDEVMRHTAASCN